MDIVDEHGLYGHGQAAIDKQPWTEQQWTNSHGQMDIY